MIWISAHHRAKWEECQQKAAGILEKTGGIVPLKGEKYGDEWRALVKEKNHHEEKGTRPPIWTD